MLDIKFLRDNPEIVKENIKKKFQEGKLPLVDQVIELDRRNRDAMTEANNLRSERNKLSKQVGMLMGQAKKDPSKLAEAEEAKAQVKANADRLAELEKLEDELAADIRRIMLQIPNIIDPSVPIGRDDSENVEVERFGEPVVPDFDIPYHTEIMESFDGVDMDAAGRVSGAGFYPTLNPATYSTKPSHALPERQTPACSSALPPRWFCRRAATPPVPNSTASPWHALQPGEPYIIRECFSKLFFPSLLLMRLLTINPGSTSTKIAVFDDTTPVFTQNIRHSVEDLAPFELEIGRAHV